MTDRAASDKAEDIRRLLEERLGIKGKTLPDAIRKAGRTLPRWARRAGQELCDAAGREDHPKLSRLTDQASVDRAHADLTTYLEGIDPKERRVTSVVRHLSVAAVNILIFIVLFLVVLSWRGFI